MKNSAEITTEWSIYVYVCMYLFFLLKVLSWYWEQGILYQVMKKKKWEIKKKTHTHTQNSQMVTEAQQQNSYVKKKKKILLDPMLFAFSTSPSP